jgi:cytochrome bd ubiquinol oxidase subunit II
MAYSQLFKGVWLLILRRIRIEFRTQLRSEVAAGLFDGFFALSGSLLALFFGAAPGNLIRGVPIGTDRSFFEPLWTTLHPWGRNGHSGLVYALHRHSYRDSTHETRSTMGDSKDGRQHSRSCLRAREQGATDSLCLYDYRSAAHDLHASGTGAELPAPVLFLFPAVVGVSLALHGDGIEAVESCRPFWRFVGRLFRRWPGTAAALYPALLPFSYGSQFDITIFNTAAGSYVLRASFIWWGWEWRWRLHISSLSIECFGQAAAGQRGVHTLGPNTLRSE